MTGAEREEMRRRRAEEDERFIASFPEEIRPLAYELLAVKSEAIKWITRKHRLQSLNVDRGRVEEVDRIVDEVKVRSQEIERRVRDAVPPHRAGGLSKEKRAEGLALLREEDAAVVGVLESQELASDQIREKVSQIRARYSARFDELTSR